MGGQSFFFRFYELPGFQLEYDALSLCSFILFELLSVPLREAFAGFFAWWLKLCVQRGIAFQRSVQGVHGLHECDAHDFFHVRAVRSVVWVFELLPLANPLVAVECPVVRVAVVHLYYYRVRV